MISTEQKNNSFKTIVYLGAFFSESEKNRILEKFPAEFPNTFADHMTISYRPTLEEVEKFPIGETIELKVTGIAKDSKAQALIVESDLRKEGTPHITISTANETKPEYSNELIAKGFTEIEPFLIQATLGANNGNHTIIEKSNRLISKIVFPVRTQPDTIVATFLLKTFGEFYFPNITSATYEFRSTTDKLSTDEDHFKNGELLIDIGGGIFDHHKKEPKVSATDLVSNYLGISNYPALSKMIEYARRDDFYGKGTISDDALDRAFGLSGLIGSLNKEHSKNPENVPNIVIPLLEAHFKEEVRRTEEMPKEFEEKLKSGKAETFSVKQRGKKLNVVIVDSDNISLAGFLRSRLGGAYDVVAQWTSSGHANVLTRPAKRIDLRSTALLIRTQEAEQNDMSLPDDMRYLSQSGRIDEIPNWYYDTATNSIQNGGSNPKDVPPTKILRFSFRKILELGLSETLWSPMRK